MSEKQLNPGSPEAVALGCTCPVMDNCNGAGFPYGDQTCWWITANCPLHDPDDEIGKRAANNGGRRHV